MRGSSGDAPRQDDAQADAAVLGIDLEKHFGSDEVAEEALWVWHIAAVEAFLAVSSQWRTVSVHNRVVPQALDYTAAQAGLQMSGLSIDAATWSEVRTIEQGAMAEFRRTM